MNCAPFNGVLGMLTLLERTRLDGSQREYVYTARNSADHLLSLLNDILDVSAMESGKMGIHPITIPLQPLVDSIDQLMRPLASQKGWALPSTQRQTFPHGWKPTAPASSRLFSTW